MTHDADTADVPGPFTPKPDPARIKNIDAAGAGAPAGEASSSHASQADIGRPRHEHIAGRAVHDHASRNWLAAFVDHWIGGKKPAQISLQAAV